MLVQRGAEQMLSHVMRVDRLAAGVGHDQQTAGVVGHHQVIDDAARLVHEQRVTLTTRSQTLKVAGGQRLQHGRGVGPAQAELAHVGHVEQAGCRAGVQVLGQHAGRVLDRHVVAGERDHLRAQPTMQRVERRREQDCGLIGLNIQDRLGHARHPRRQVDPLAAANRITTPLCPVYLRDSGAPALTPSVRQPPATVFPEVLFPVAVLGA